MIALLLFLSLRAVGAAEADSYCVVAGTPTSGTGDCSTGDVFLKGTYIELGIHNSFTFGSSQNAPSGYQLAGQPFSFIADFDQNGWSGSPGYSGDYVFPGTDLEGKCYLHESLYFV